MPACGTPSGKWRSTGSQSGLDPDSSSFVIESLVPEHAELTTWLAWVLPVGMLERNPTLKAEMEAIENPKDGKTKGKAVPVAFYIYPVMQVANILFPRAHLVPVGEDQLPHIELARETARRFNRDSSRFSRSRRRSSGAYRVSWAPMATRR